MNALSPLRPVHVALRHVFLGALLSLVVPGALKAQLLIENHQGGPNQYLGISADIYYAQVHFDEAVRVTGITGWINGGGDDAAIGLSGEQLETGFYQTYQPVGAPSGHPAIWQGVNSLKWDLQPGTYLVSFTNVGMPFSYGYHGPLSSAPAPDVLYRFDYPDTWELAWGGFGVRVYGTPLSAVPEPSTTGFFGALLLGTVILRHNRKRS